MRFEDVDYSEATRYSVLNWTQEECRTSKIKRVLPWRRGRCGTGPGSQASQGRVRGDQEQWGFPQIILEEWGKIQIIASVLKIGTGAIFQKHY